MDSDEEIQSNTCEIIKVSQLFVKDVKELEKEYERIKEKLINEIIEEVLEEVLEDKNK
jgi:hypothetical protein